ncbi:unnamed protein product [Phytophthora fragariaefolia]|uniref:Unnamed protein product n=1 Tax=Phytophthora fragariaefolia TaxID=1490495 RepID=A0A9W7CQW3_9STRA|nr:unnamed protein product [Phytophthora fragariaefolia]
MKSGRIEMEGGPTPQTGSGGRLSIISEKSVSFDESAGGISEAKDEEVNEYDDSEADGYVLMMIGMPQTRLECPQDAVELRALSPETSLANLMKWPSQSLRAMTLEARTRSRIKTSGRTGRQKAPWQSPAHEQQHACS